MRSAEITMPVPYEVSDMDSLLELIDSEKVLIAGGWKANNGKYVVLGTTIVNEVHDGVSL